MDFAKKQTVDSIIAYILKQRDIIFQTQPVLEAAGIRKALDQGGSDAVYELLESNPELNEVFDKWNDAFDNCEKANAHIGEHYSQNEKQKILIAVGDTFFKIK